MKSYEISVLISLSCLDKEPCIPGIANLKLLDLHTQIDANIKARKYTYLLLYLLA
jgi:hypothetical protein